jgi:HK97 family phage major capsid protein
VEGFLRQAFVERIGRVTNLHFTQGTGSGQPMGINTAATAAPNPVTTSETTLVVSYNDLVNLEHSVDRAYRKGGKFMLGDSVLKSIKKLKDSLGRPLWAAGVGQNAPDTILGYSYVINTEMPAPVSGGNLMLFGALDKYLIRDVKELQVQRLSERFAEQYQTAFIGFARFDGQLIDAGTHPVLALVSA